MVVAVAGEDDNNAAITTTGTNPAAYTEHYVESATGADGVITFSEAARTTAGATGNASVNWGTAVPIGFGGIVLALKPLPVLDSFLVEAAAGGDIGTQAAGTSFNIKITAKDRIRQYLHRFHRDGGHHLHRDALRGRWHDGRLHGGGARLAQRDDRATPGSFTITATNTAGAEAGTSNAFTVTPGAVNNFKVESTAARTAWYHDAWPYRKKITIDQTKVGSGGVTNFPVLVSRTDTDLQSKAQADGDDILFTSSDGTTKLSHQIEKYVSGTGNWSPGCEVPSLSSSAATTSTCTTATRGGRQQGSRRACGTPTSRACGT